MSATAASPKLSPLKMDRRKIAQLVKVIAMKGQGSSRRQVTSLDRRR